VVGAVLEGAGIGRKESRRGRSKRSLSRHRSGEWTRRGGTWYSEVPAPPVRYTGVYDRQKLYGSPLLEKSEPRRDGLLMVNWVS